MSSCQYRLYKCVLYFVISCFVFSLVHSQTCSLRADNFETEFCKVRQEVDVLLKDDFKVANNELEISKLWHKLQEETKDIDDNRKAIANLQQNITNDVSGEQASKDVQEMIQNITSAFDSRISDLTDMVVNLSQKLDDLALKCRGCSQDIHPCDYKPCKNGAKCIQVAKDYACVCPAGFSGKNCDVSDHCQPNPCANNGTCINNIIDHTCVCPMSYRGRNCTIEILPCDTSPCTRGKCVPDGKSYKCICDPGFYGEMCNSIVDLALLTTSTTTMTSTTFNTSASTTVSSTKLDNLTTTTSTSVTSAINTTAALNVSSTNSIPNITSTVGACSDPSVCNAPSKCVPSGLSYECKCPETKATMSDPCISPYYFEMFAICCTVDTCQPGGQPNCS